MYIASVLLIIVVNSLFIISHAQQQACTLDTECPTRSFCQKSSCTNASAGGFCVGIPYFCATLYNPVCGCDENTYNSLCTLHASKQSLAYTGECNPIRCTNNTQCLSGQFCQKTTSCFDTGVCKKFPRTCAPDSTPVCGCDGSSYTNECNANLMGVSIESKGICPINVTNCSNSTGCPALYYCRKEVGVCGSAQGKCFAKPITCATQYDPVCGCNGKTYTNGCFAEEDGISLFEIGICNTTTECSTNADCNSTQYCEKDVNTCTEDSFAGLCVERPQTCFGTVEPVCGCNNVTYTNDCFAFTAGINIAYTTACKSKK